MVSRVPIQELSDKTIGHCSSGIGFSIMAAKRIFQHNGLREPENFLYIKNGLLTALLAGQVDAVINIYKTYNLLDIEKYKGTKNFYVYPYGDNGVPSFASLILVANTHTPIPHIDALNRALKRACVYFQNNLDETWQLFIRKYPENNTELNRRVWWLLAPLFHVTPFQDHVENKPLKDFLESEHAA
jgi:putative hydroxymethylpyrimidine transport system substrate-binding protein